MGVEKTLVGEAAWTEGPHEGCSRWLSPLAIDGVTIGMNLCVDVYTRSPKPDFHILLIYEICIARLDFSELDRHRNHTLKSVRTPAAVDIGWIFGPHFHRWCNNRGLAMPGSRPKTLEFAVKLPQNVRTFEASFRHFCAECLIRIAANQLPSLPPRDRLI